MIRGEDGNPLEGVALYVGGHRYTTGKDGRYGAPDIPGGTYALTIRVPYELRRKTMLHDEKRGEAFGYPNTLFYPGEPQAGRRGDPRARRPHD
ncbi:MAG: carboxypeptidase-like regulatory domain-containing protein [Candidatus Sulfopaludibacter sp.]|nr:carboxypeptidase-like regulatory domain-containing protein [Candidatus Sulfopaludibacter sp.]